MIKILIPRIKKLMDTFSSKRKIGGDSVDGSGPSDPKKIKEEEKENEKLTEEIKKQNKIQFKYRDQLETLTKQELQILLEYNDQQIPSGTSEVFKLLIFDLSSSFFGQDYKAIVFLGAGPSC